MVLTPEVEQLDQEGECEAESARRCVRLTRGREHTQGAGVRGLQTQDNTLQGYLADKKPPHPSTLQ